jgi:hypothetical protein
MPIASNKSDATTMATDHAAHHNALAKHANAVGEVVAEPTGTAATDTAAINGAITALSGEPGRILLHPGDYAINAQIALTTGQRLVGAGGIAPGVGWPETTKAATALVSSFNGSVVKLNGHASGISDLMLYGDTAQASQILLDVGDTAGAAATSKFSVHRVHLKGGGLDNIRIRGLVLESDFQQVYAHGAVRYNLYADGAEANANTFRACLFREATQYGVRLAAGAGWRFDTCVFESNSAHGSTAYGGLLLDSGASYGPFVHLSTCYFENNGGFNDTGPPIKIDGGKVIDLGGFYADNASLQLNGGYYIATGVHTNIATHVTIGASATGATFIDCEKYGGGSFAYGGAGVTKAIRLDHAGAHGPLLQFANDRIFQRNVSSGFWEMDFLDITSALDVSTYASFGALAAASAPNNSIFRDSADNVIKIKDNGGTVRLLY